jgi:2-keto-4-pentenoate hydratase/2-oxohepta-3-ene-1,7-dioic acid hydratase in catechol pathway
MKLCRFDLATSPGTPRSGIVYGGKVYETEGTQPVAVHDWDQAHLLSPVGQPPSFRLFFPSGTPEEPRESTFRYLNPNAIIGPHRTVLARSGSALTCLPCLAAVVAGGGFEIPLSEADGVVLGITLANVFCHTLGEPLAGAPASRTHAGAAVGPAITTPDELDDTVLDEALGRRYGLDVALRVNEEEVAVYGTANMPQTIAELLSQASRSCPLRQGDLVAVALGEPLPAGRLRTGDQVRWISDRLGALATKLDEPETP